MKNFSFYLCTFLLICLTANQILGQKQIKAVGNVRLTVQSKTIASSHYNFDVPVNKKLPLLFGDSYSIEESGTGNTQQLNGVAIASKNNPQQALLKVTFIVSKSSKKTTVIEKKLKIRKGQTKSFQLKYKDFHYELTAFYEP